jgi:hypothetical protein
MDKVPIKAARVMFAESGIFALKGGNVTFKRFDKNGN